MSQTMKTVVTSLSLIAVLGAAVTLVIHTGQNARQAEIQFRQMSNIAGNGSAIATSNAGPQPGTLNGSKARPTPVSAERVQQLGFQLMSSQNPKVRQDIAETFGQIASSQNVSSTEPGPQEPKMVDLLQAAYSQERDPDVRKAIVANVAAFNHPAALQLLNSAAEKDLDEAVRKAAAAARTTRENRLVLAGSMEFPTRTWR